MMSQESRLRRSMTKTNRNGVSLVNSNDIGNATGFDKAILLKVISEEKLNSKHEIR